jgi:PPE-repeat protein
MAFNFGAFASGFSESVAEGIKENEKRVNLLVDKAWDTHTQRYWKKRDKEEGKAELVEGAIKKLAQLTDGNIDHAAALYNKIGNVNDATTFANNGLQLKGLGQDLSGYVGSMPDTFEGSNLTVEDYAKSYMKPIKFETELGVGAQDGVSEGLKIRAEQMAGLGIPSTLEPTKVTFANLTDANINSLTMPKNIEATKNILTQNALKAEQAGDDEAFKKATEGLQALNNIKEIGEGGDAELTRIKSYRTDMQTFLSKQLSTQRTELEGSGIVSFDSAGNVSKILKPKEYKSFRIKQLNNYKKTYVTRLKGTKLANFNEAYNLVIGGDAVKIALEDTDKTKNNLEPKVEVPETTKIKLPVPDDRIIKDIQTNGKQTVIDSLVNSANYTQEEAEAKVESLTSKLGYGTYGISGTGMNLPKDK